MSNNQSYVEVLPGSPYPNGFYPGSGKSTSWLNKRRLFIFLGIFALGCLVSLTYNFLRAAIYESAGTLLFILPVRDNEANAKMDTQHVEAQRQVLISNPILTKILNNLEGRDASNTSANRLSDLKRMLRVIPTDNMNVVKLSASGQNRELLPFLANTWIDVYLKDLADLEKSSFNSKNTGLYRQVNELELKVIEKRKELEQFRAKHDIVSMKRDENWTLARFNGLTESLKKAQEEQIVADALLKAIKNTIAQGKTYVRVQDQAVITNLEDRYVEIQDHLREIGKRYTPEYMKIDNQAKTLVGRQELLKKKIRQKQEESQQLALTEAEQAQVAAQQTVVDLQKQLEKHKEMVANFSGHFAEHEALEEELSQLEYLYNEVSNGLVKTEVINKQQLPRIQVLEHAFLPEQPIWPHYSRDAGISVAGSFLLGLLAVWFYEFLTRPATQIAGVQNQPLFYAVSGSQKMRIPAIREAQSEQLMLEQHLHRELSESDVKALTDAANDSTGLLINTILSGLSIEEAAALRWSHIDLKSEEIHVPGEKERTIPLSVMLRDTLTQCSRADAETDAYLWQNKKNKPLSASDLSKLISQAARDAKISNPSEIDEHSISYTYQAFLIRQGVRLEELERITGKLPHTLSAAYAILSPPDTGLAIDEIETVYPTLRNV